MDIFDLKKIFPNSFINYLGKRRVIVTLQYSYCVKSIRSSFKAEGLEIGECKYHKENDTTSFEVSRKSYETPFKA